MPTWLPITISKLIILVTDNSEGIKVIRKEENGKMSWCPIDTMWAHETVKQKCIHITSHACNMLNNRLQENIRKTTLCYLHLRWKLDKIVWWCLEVLVITSLSLSDSVGKSIWIWEACRVNNDPAKVAEFLITQTTSWSFTSFTCTTHSET